MHAFNAVVKLDMVHGGQVKRYCFDNIETGLTTNCLYVRETMVYIKYL